MLPYEPPLRQPSPLLLLGWPQVRLYRIVGFRPVLRIFKRAVLISPHLVPRSGRHGLRLLWLCRACWSIVCFSNTPVSIDVFAWLDVQKSPTLTCLMHAARAPARTKRQGHSIVRNTNAQCAEANSNQKAITIRNAHCECKLYRAYSGRVHLPGISTMLRRGSGLVDYLNIHQCTRNG